LVAETPNFRIHWCATEAKLRDLAASCEDLRSRVGETWVPENENVEWNPRCEIVIHADVGSYVRHLGAGSEQTSGCATLTLDQGRVVLRRIDLRADAADWQAESLPHELTHIVIADHFTERRIPPWADEGIAMLAESPTKLKRRCDYLKTSMQNGASCGIERIVKATGPLPGVEPSAFYCQSVALVAFLLDRGTPQLLLEFLKSGQTMGYERAMREVYGFESWTDMDRGWRSAASPAYLAQFARHQFPRVEPVVTLTSTATSR
jgi:hypothetical protein